MEIIKERFEDTEPIEYYEDKYEIVTRVAFLCGVQDAVFEREESCFLQEVITKLRKEPRAMIVRNLCLLRNTIEHHYKQITNAMYQDKRSFYALREFVPMEALQYLEEEGIRLPVNSRVLTEILGEINRNIGDRINNCKELFPTWINWAYIKDLFLMPNGTKVPGMTAAADLFYANKALYPYGTYINWEPHDVGNLFKNDFKFVKTLYELHSDRLYDTSNLSDVSQQVKNKIYDFIENGDIIDMVVDCENADPYSLCAMFHSLEQEQLQKIDKLILYDDPQASSGWTFFEKNIPLEKERVEHIVIERILDYKSLLDVRLSAKVSAEFYRRHVDSFILVSSDSDFWGLIKEIPEADFLLMVEHQKTSMEYKKILDENYIFYCFTDDFYTGMDDSFMRKAIFFELYGALDSFKFNARDLLYKALETTRIRMDPAEFQQFYDKHLKNMKLLIDKDGTVSIEMNK